MSQKSAKGSKENSRNGYDCSLRKKSLFLNFRDKAFNTYFKSTNYKGLIKKTFGNETVKHIVKMTSFNLKRKHHDQDVDY